MAAVLLAGAVPVAADPLAGADPSVVTGVELLAEVADASGVEPVTGGGSGSVAVSDVTASGLVVSLPADGDGVVWMDDPFGFDLGLGLPSVDSRVEAYCPTGGWFLRDGVCLRRVAFSYVWSPLEYEYADYEYDYLDYTYQVRDYEYATRVPSTHTQVEEVEEWDPIGGGQHEPPCEDGEGSSWAQWPNGGAGGAVCNVPGWVTRIREVQVPDEPPAGWEWNDDGTVWQQRLPVPAGWFDSGFDWQRRDPTPDGWEDYGDEFTWRKLITGPLADGWEHSPARDRWRRLLPMGDGWVQTAGAWRHLAPTPSGYVVDDVSWVTTVPARSRRVPADAPAGPDTSTIEVIHPAPTPVPIGSGARWDTDATITPDTSTGGTAPGADGAVDLAGSGQATVTRDGTVIYDGGTGAGAVLGQVLSDGAVRLAVTIPDAHAPRSFEVPLIMPDYMAPVAQPDGTILVMALLARDDPATADVDEELWEIEFALPAPWAKDANGRPVTTWYTLDGTTLTQHIAPDAATVFPVLADPTAKQNRQAATARQAAQAALVHAQAAAKARTQVQEAKAAAAKRAAAAEAKLLAARANTARREELTRQAQAKAAAAKKALADARKAAALARDHAEAARKAAKTATGAARKLAAANVTSLTKAATKAARVATNAASDATISARAATRAEAATEASRESVKDSLATAKATLAVYQDASLTAQQKITATQPLLDRYAVRVQARKTQAANSTRTTTLPVATPDMPTKGADRTKAQQWANIVLDYTVNGTRVGYLTIGDRTPDVTVTVTARNTGITALDGPLDYKMTAPAASTDPHSAATFTTSTDIHWAGLSTQRKGCTPTNGGHTAECTIPPLPGRDAVNYRWTLTANPHQTTPSHDTALRTNTGTITTLLPVILRQNQYQADYDRNGYVEYLDRSHVSGGTGLPGSGTPMTIGIYSPTRATDILTTAQRIVTTHQAALAACGYGTTAEQYLNQWYRQTFTGRWEALPQWANAIQQGGYPSTITVVAFEQIKKALAGAQNIPLDQLEPMLTQLKSVAALGGMATVVETTFAFGVGSCAAKLAFAQESLDFAGRLPGLVVSTASKMVLTFDASATDASVGWLAELRAGARAGCTRIEWFDDNEPRVATANTKPPGGIYELAGTRPPSGDPAQRWSVKCKGN